MIEWNEGKAGERFPEPNPGVEAELLAGGGEAGEDGDSSAAVVGAEEEPVLAADGERLDRSFGDVVIDGEIAVSGVDVDRGPLIACISDGLAQGTFRQGIHRDLIEPLFQRKEKRHRLLLAKSLLFRGIAFRLLGILLDGVQLFDACDRLVSLARTRLLRLDELTPCMSPAADLDDRSMGGSEQFVVTGIGVALQIL